MLKEIGDDDFLPSLETALSELHENQSRHKQQLDITERLATMETLWQENKQKGSYGIQTGFMKLND